MDLSAVSAGTAARLVAAGLDPDLVADVIARTVAEDLDGGVDITSVSTVPAEQRSTVTFGARADGCLAGLDIACAVVETVCGPGNVTIERVKSDGDRVRTGDVIARVTAPTRRMLTAERTALNLLCHLSGVATATSMWVDAVAGTGAIIRDTRKTTPMLRRMEKYAVRCGGGQNHRMSLSDAALVKDNHIAAAGGVRNALARAKALGGHMRVIEIEVDTLEQLAEALPLAPHCILLDNMSLAELREAVTLTAGRAVLEASGNVRLETVGDIAATGVDVISVGALTHSARRLDLGLDVT